MEGDHIKTHAYLAPLAWLYAAATSVRNFMFETGILKSKSYDIPIISIGNITVGGTGKTPHTEYIIRLLQDKNQVAVLSRGYKRKSKGFVLAETNTPMSMIGDEPYQMKKKFPNILMAVDKDRCEAIEKLTAPEMKPEVDVILLDDGYQYRYVQPGMNILLTDYHRLICFDKVLPAGRLREPKRGQNRADVVIVTKCPANITPMEMHGISRSLDLESWQQIFFTTFVYGNPYRMDDNTQTITLDELAQKDILLVTGIASPEQMEYDLKKLGIKFESMHFPDHHDFTAEEKSRIKERSRDKIILMTEKDAARIEGTFGEESSRVYVLPVEVEFLGDKDDIDFNKIIKSYVSKNSRNSILSKNRIKR